MLTLFSPSWMHNTRCEESRTEEAWEAKSQEDARLGEEMNIQLGNSLWVSGLTTF